MLSVLFISYLYQQPNSFVCQSDVTRVQTFHKHQLPSIQTVLIDLHQFMQTANSEVFHVVVSVIEEFVEDLAALIYQVGVGINIADCLDGLL